MAKGTLQALFRLLTHAFDDLDAKVPLDKLESLAVTIYAAMSTQARHYHNLDHVFNFLQPPDPIRYLAAVFHDIVYYQVDDGLPQELEEELHPHLVRLDSKFYLPNPMPDQDGRIACLMELFGFTPGQQITYAQGLNEFLSALVTVKRLGGLISEHDLFQVLLCIEATIPFRGKDAQGREHFVALADRLTEMRTRYPFIGTPDQIDRALQRAVVFSNQDVETFSQDDVALFLVITFKLLPESNVALRKAGVYTIRDYRIGLQNMEKFLRFLDPDDVFNRYKGVPPDDEYAHMVKRSHANVGMALRYIEVKLLAMALLEGLANATGGDGPLSLFMGDLPIPGVEITRMEDFLPNITLPDFVDPNSELLRVFSEGLQELGFDLPYSPLSLFIYKSLNHAQQDDLYAQAKELFDGRMAAEDFLRLVPPHVLGPVAKAVAQLVFTRREKLLRWA
jgi:hypothetical protein